MRFVVNSIISLIFRWRKQNFYTNIELMNLIITGGEAPSSLPPFRYENVIAADSGYDTALALGSRVDCVVGDFDSVKDPSALLSAGYKALPRDKDWSDTEVAIRSIEGEYDLIGGGGGRADHFLSLFSLFATYPPPRFWFTKEDILISVYERCSLRIGTGCDISFIAFPGLRCHVKSSGLVWPLDSLELSAGFVSLSNRSCEEVVNIISDNPLFIRVPMTLLHQLQNVLI